MGTQTIFVGFTPTDTIDYASVSTSVMIVVNPAVPTLGNFTPRYVAADTFSYFTNYTIPCAGCASGDIFHDASGLFSPDLTLPSAMSSLGITLQWQPGTYEPWFDTWEVEHPAGPFGNQSSTAFLGSGSQSTLAVSPVTGTLFQDEQAVGQLHLLKTDGTTSSFGVFSRAGQPVNNIAIDDVTGMFVVADTVTTPDISAQDEKTGKESCSFKPGITFISSVAAKGGYMVFTESVDNLVGVAKMDCTGYHTITGVANQAWVGQPWSVAMVNGTKLDTYILTRDKWSTNGLPGLTKVRINSDGTTTVMGSVELTGLLP